MSSYLAAQFGKNAQYAGRVSHIFRPNFDSQKRSLRCRHVRMTMERVAEAERGLLGYCAFGRFVFLETETFELAPVQVIPRAGDLPELPFRPVLIVEGCGPGFC